MDAKTLYVRVDAAGHLGFGADTPESIIELERLFPAGVWKYDWDGRPTLVVAGVRFEKATGGECFEDGTEGEADQSHYEPTADERDAKLLRKFNSNEIETCADCHLEGERTGHQTCQYPQDHE